LSIEIVETERQRFVDWTFDKQMACFEEDDAGTLPVDFELPTFLGHDMDWWSKLALLFCLPYQGRDRDLGPCLLDHLGITDAVLAWMAAEKAQRKEIATLRRKDRKEWKQRFQARSKTIASLLS
jgi:hypothetical protein